MFIVLRSCLLSSIMVIIQTLNNIIIEIKIRKKLELCFESKCYRDKTRKVRNIRYKYRRQLMLTAAV